MTQTQQKITAIFPELKLELDYPLAPLTYFKIGGPAEVFLATNDKEAVASVVRFCTQENIKLTLLGGGSNVVVADAGLKGLVLHLTNSQVEDTGRKIQVPRTPDITKTIVRSGAGIKTALLVSQTVNLGFTGLEYFLGVPGTLGGAVYNNSHYFQDLIDEHIAGVEAITRTGEVVYYDHQECEFGYESSRFQRTKEIIFAVDFALADGDSDESRKMIKEATEYRAMTQPLGPPSSGCIFQNVANNDKLKALFPRFADKSHVPGGFIIDQAGLKGESVGGVHVSEKHAAWFINDGSASAADVKALIKKVKKNVRLKFGIDLQEEVFYLE